MLSKLAVRRLTKLADYLDSLPKAAIKHFDMWRVGPVNLTGKKELLKLLKSCGTTACAMGWAATIPSFRRAGWLSGWENEESFFDIGPVEADALFYTADPKTPKQWAKHCRKFLRENA